MRSQAKLPWFRRDRGTEWWQLGCGIDHNVVPKLGPRTTRAWSMPAVRPFRPLVEFNGAIWSGAKPSCFRHEHHRTIDLFIALVEPPGYPMD